MISAICGIRFFYEKTLDKQQAIFNLVRPAPEKNLPMILTIEEVLKILGLIRFERFPRLS